MKKFNEWLGEKVFRKLAPKIKISVRGASLNSLLLNFSVTNYSEKPKNAFEPQIVVNDQKYIDYLINSLSEDNKTQLLNGFSVELQGEEAEKIIKLSLNRSELGWDHVARYYGIKEDPAL